MEEQLRQIQLSKKEVIPNQKTSLWFKCYKFVMWTVVIATGKESNKTVSNLEFIEYCRVT
jgi:hypothetical protein